MKLILSILLACSISYADKIKGKTLACPTISQLQKAPLGTEDDNIMLSMYAIANNCISLDKRDDIEALGYDPLNSKNIYQKIIYKKTDVYLYMLKSYIQIEQAGKKSSFRF